MLLLCVPASGEESHSPLRIQSRRPLTQELIWTSMNKDVEDIIRRFMEALYYNDQAEYEKTVVPHPESRALIRKNKLTAEEMARRKADVSDMEFTQSDPFSYQGEDIQPDEKGGYPVGTKATFMVQYHGAHFAVPVTMTTDGWKVDDIRYSIAAGKKYRENDPESVVKTFLFYLLSHNEEELKKVVPAGSNPAKFFKGEPPFAEAYYYLAVNMSVVQANTGEGMKLPENQLLVAQESTSNHKWYVGLYGTQQIVFEIIKEKTGWKVIPQDYLSVIGIGQDESATMTEEP